MLFFFFFYHYTVAVGLAMKTTEVKCHSHQFISKVYAMYQHDIIPGIDLYYPAGILFVKFSSVIQSC